jgi:hypothetical protein
MIIINSRDTLVFARERARRLLDEAAADHLRRAASRRRTFGASIRHTVRRWRLDAASIAHRPV